MARKRGKFIVIDGTDGSGKATQIGLLAKKLKDLKIPYEVIDFPRYKDNIYGRLVGRYLKGEFGGLNEVNPYLASLTYAGDRMLAKPLIEKWLKMGKIVLANRYVSSNKAHQTSKFPKHKQASFMEWLNELEYQTNGLPKEDLTIFLYVDPQIATKNVELKGKRSYIGKKKKDIAEDNIQHQIDSSKMYLRLAKTEPGWRVIQCMAKEAMKSREEIHEEIVGVLKEKGILAYE